MTLQKPKRLESIGILEPVIAEVGKDPWRFEAKAFLKVDLAYYSFAIRVATRYLEVYAGPVGSQTTPAEHGSVI